MQYLFFCLLLPVLSCNTNEANKEQASAGNNPIKNDTIPPAAGGSLQTRTFDITSLIPGFARDTSFHAVSGVTAGTDIQETVSYSIYRLPRKNAFTILRMKSNDTKLPGNKQKSSYTEPVKISSKDFFNSVYGLYEKNPAAQKFYNKIHLLNGYEIFFASTYGYMHWLFFDKNSDTVYQRTQLMTY